MVQSIKAEKEQDFVNDMEYEIPECEFRFTYSQAISPDYAEDLVDQLNKKQEEKNNGKL